MNSTPAVSVLIPCRNAERYLAATLESAERQTLPPVEIIVVDDGSTDRSREIAGRFAPLVTLRANPGRGVSAARDHAARGARGDFYQFLDADDLLEPGALASRVAALQATGADVAVSDWLRLAEQGDRWVRVKEESGRLPDDGSPVDLAVFRGFWAPPAAILYRRSVCERVGGWRDSLPIIQDARFLLDAARVGGKFTHVPGIGAHYRQHHGASLSTTDRVAFCRDVLQNTREVERLWRDAGRLDPTHRTAIADGYAHAARVGFDRDRALFEAAGKELSRFPEYAGSRLLRLALPLARIAGYRIARVLLATWCR
jgi:glycosyltransferase involved in cell wall biosynthesis